MYSSPFNSMARRIIVVFAYFLFIGLSSVTSVAQTGTYFNQRDDQYRLLGLKRAKQAYDVSKTEYERQKQLFDDGLITQAEFDRARAEMSDAEVNFQQSLLAVLFERQYVTVTSAVKYYADDGSRHVRLIIANASSGGAEFQKLINIDDELFRSLQPDIINDVYVSLLNGENSIISKPYESKIAQLVYGDPATLDFRLLEDVDNVTVSLIYGSGTQRSMRIFLEKDISSNKVAVQSEQFSQEVDLGRSASYDLGLELFSDAGNTFSLEVLNLPTQISRTFRDPLSSARLSQVKFTETTRTKRASLDITLPERPTVDVTVDEPVQFFVVCVPPDRAEDIPGERGKRWTADELDKLDIGYVRLELVPRGAGILRVRSNQLYQRISPGEPAVIRMELANEGSDRLDNVEFRFDLPLNWEKQAETQAVTSLGIGEDTVITLTFVPPTDIVAGRYDIRVQTTAQSNGRSVSSDEKTATVEIEPTRSLAWTILIVLFVVGVVGGMSVFGVRLSRK